MKACVLRAVGAPTRIEELTVRPLASHEVRVRVAASGVCHTDLSIRDGSMPALLPATIGHEGAGVVVVTGVGAVVRTAQVRPGDTVLVLGCGGVGLAAVQAARLSGAARIVAADRSASALQRAQACGATDVVDAGAVEVPAAVRELTDGVGVDHGIEVVGLSTTIRAAYDATRRGGIVTVVGAGRGDDDVRISALSLMADAKQIR